jgi:ligand-binding sensor domain-containing protein
MRKMSLLILFTFFPIIALYQLESLASPTVNNHSSCDWVNSKHVTSIGYVISVYVTDGKIYAGGGDSLSISSDGGNTWITKNITHRLGRNSVRSVFVVGNKIYVGTDDGLSISSDGGNTWTSHGLGGNDIFYNYGNVVVSVYVTGGKIYAGRGSSSVLMLMGGLSISSDGGNSWNTTAGMLDFYDESGSVSSVFVVDSKIYVGTHEGLSISSDGGNSWITKTTTHGLGRNSVSSVFVVGNKIYVGTHDGGLFIFEETCK